MDFVYIFKQDLENDSEELRYSLRSLANIPHGRVFLVGEKPDWATNVEFIPVAQTKTKQENWNMNMRAAVNSTDISEEFVLMNDDFFIMHLLPEVPNWHMGPLDEVIANYERRYPGGSDYINSMKRTYKQLLAMGYDTPVSYELHMPMVLRKSLVKQWHVDRPNVGSLQFRTMYGNLNNLGGVQVKDGKVFVDPVHNDPLYNDNPLKYLQSQPILSATGGSFKRTLVGDYVRRTLAEPSPYELVK